MAKIAEIPPRSSSLKCYKTHEGLVLREDGITSSGSSSLNGGTSRNANRCNIERFNQALLVFNNECDVWTTVEW